jgi:hypothetical protein
MEIRDRRIYNIWFPSKENIYSKGNKAKNNITNNFKNTKYDAKLLIEIKI